MNNGPAISPQSIRAARRAVGKNLEDAAHCIGTTIPYASDIERGRVTPTQEQVKALAELYGVRVELLQ